MSNDKKPMTVKSWLRKADSKVSPAAFLAAHRTWLETGELAEVASPILRIFDEGQLLPTPALDLLKDAVFTHWHAAEVAKAERRIDEAGQRESTKVVKNWLACVYTAKGEPIDELEQSFALASDADRYIDRKLFDGMPGSFGVVSHTVIMRADGDPISTVVTRDDAIARILAKPKAGAFKKTGSRDGKLSWGVKAKQSHASFSRG